MECRRIIISGMVQGVGYRYAAWRKAVELGVTGFVKNLRDGRVEIIAEGEAEKLNKFVAWCREGPPYARVDHVSAVPESPGNFREFSIR